MARRSSNRPLQALAALVLILNAPGAWAQASPAAAQKARPPQTLKQATQPSKPPPPAAAPVPPIPAAPAQLAEAVSPATIDFQNGRATISFLGDAINWYRGIDLEEPWVEEPADLLFFTDDRAQASEILRLSFEYARAEAALLTTTDASGVSASRAEADLTGQNLQKRRLELLAAQARAAATVNNLKQQQLKAPKSQRESLSVQLAQAQNELDLASSRLELFTTMSQFESTELSGEGSNSLLGQIDALDRSVPRPAEGKGAVAPSVPQLQKIAEPTGILGTAKHLLALQSKTAQIKDRLSGTQQLATAAEGALKPLHDWIVMFDRRATELASQIGTEGSGQLSLSQRRQEFERLLAERKLVVAAALPLRMQTALLKRYTANLRRWRKAVEEHRSEQLHSLMARLIAIGVTLAIIVLLAVLWRSLVLRYVEDVNRRRQAMKFRNFIVGFLIVIVLLFNFISEIGALATVLGFAAAGIAVALQDVILSFAAYFLISGRFGIRVGDRVELQGVRGDVVDIGLTKLTLMEVSDNGDHSATGRVVVIPNSAVFKEKITHQAPGTNLAFDEIHLTLSPDADYRLAEKRLIEVVNEVFARYRESARRQFQDLERRLNIRIDSPKPQARMKLDIDGIHIILRYPVEIRNRSQIADEISRRLLDAITREPTLKLVPRTAASIQMVQDAEGGAAAEQPQTLAGQRVGAKG